MGATMMRFFRVRERMVSGRKRVGVVGEVGKRAAPGELAGVKKGVFGALVALGMIVCMLTLELFRCGKDGYCGFISPMRLQVGTNRHGHENPPDL
jgi:hypothetical protein